MGINIVVDLRGSRDTERKIVTHLGSILPYGPRGLVCGESRKGNGQVWLFLHPQTFRRTGKAARVRGFSVVEVVLCSPRRRLRAAARARAGSGACTDRSSSHLTPFSPYGYGPGVMSPVVCINFLSQGSD